MTDHEETADGAPVLTLQVLIRTRMDEHGWSYADLERLSNGGMTRGRWHQLGTGQRMTNFPEPASLQIIADTIGVDITTVLVATGASLGLPVRHRGSDMAQLLPAGTDRLPDSMRDALLAIIRAAVAHTLTVPDEGEADGPNGATLRWPKGESASGTGSIVKRP